MQAPPAPEMYRHSARGLPLLGGNGTPDTPYARLVASLERHLGAGVCREEDFGPLGRGPQGQGPAAPRRSPAPMG